MTHPKLSNPKDGTPAVDFLSLLGRCLGNFKILERVLATFRDSGWSDLSQLQTAIEQSDYQSVVDISHRFKGAASNVSATELTKLLAETEQLGHAQNGAELNRILEDLRSEWESILQYVRAFVPASGGMTQGAHRPTQETSEARHACAGC